MTNYTILLPPSETKTKNGDDSIPYKKAENLYKYNTFHDQLSLAREIVYDKLILAVTYWDKKDLEKLFEVKEKKLEEVIDITNDLINSPTKPAIERYDGVMFKAIDYSTLSPLQKKHFDSSTLFIDGLFGALTPTDHIPDYKLKITSKIKDLNLTQLWREKLKKLLEDYTKDKIVIDLLPQAHKKVVTLSNSATHIQIIFAEEINGKLKEKGHFSKQLKGEIIRHIIQHEVITPQTIQTFTHSQGYDFSQKHSDKNTFVFLKQ